MEAHQTVTKLEGRKQLAKLNDYSIVGHLFLILGSKMESVTCLES